MTILGTENESLEKKDSLIHANEAEKNDASKNENADAVLQESVSSELTPMPESEAPAIDGKEEPEVKIVAEVDELEGVKVETQEILNADGTEEVIVEITETEENPVLEQIAEELVAEASPEQPEDVVENQEQLEANEHKLAALSREELVKHLKELVALPNANKNEIDLIKQLFYKKQKAELGELRKKQQEEKEEVEGDVEPQKDLLEEELKNLLAEYKNKKAAQNQKQQQQKEQNLLAKTKIIDHLKTLTDDMDSIENINEAIAVVRGLQLEWKNAGVVPAENANELWKNYQLYIEKFYDYVKINNELREYDLKKNLELKTAICEQAEKLADVSDVQTAFRILQALHDEWKETGPVVRELREEIWERLKNASAIINKKHQAYFEGKKEEEEKNLAEKIALCERVESVDFEALKTYKDWDDKTKEVVDIQAVWKLIGFAPKKANVKIYERFRAACDNFFKRKNEFFLRAKNELNDNLAKKVKLCEQAESLKDSTDWKETGDALIKLQKEWKTIGAVPRKQSDAVWKRFIAACDFFFEQKGKSTAGEKQQQEANLAQKKEIIAKVEALNGEEDSREAFKQLKEFIAQWNAIGFVPFKEKDKVYKAFKKATDAAFDKLKVEEHDRRLHLFRTSLEDITDKSSHKLFRERDKLKKELEYLSNEISTYENNIGFFSSSKKADKLIKDMEKKIESLKKEKELIIKKIDLIENNLS